MMHIALKQLSAADDHDIYDMLQELPVEENGFMNNVNGRSFEEYQRWLIKSEGIAQGVHFFFLRGKGALQNAVFRIKPLDTVFLSF